MKIDRIGNTIDLILLILFSVSSVFLCIQINLSKYWSVFTQILFIILLIVILLVFFLLTLKSKKLFYIRKLILILLSRISLLPSLSKEKLNLMFSSFQSPSHHIVMVL